MLDTAGRADGTQSLRRALRLLRLLGEHQEDGLRLADIVRATGLERPTAHRVLACLVDEHYADKDPQRKTYRLGLAAMQLGVASMRRAPLVGDFQALMKRLARITQETIFLQIREGDYGVCLHREAGTAPVRVFTIDVGGRRLLGIGAGGLAMLANLEDARIDEILQRNRDAYEALGFDARRLWHAVRRTREQGYATIRDTTTPGVSGLGFAFRTSGSVVASLSLGAITQRLPLERRRVLAVEMQAHIAQVAELLDARLRGLS